MFSFDPKTKDIKDNDDDEEQEKELFVKICQNNIDMKNSSNQQFKVINTDANNYFIQNTHINNKIEDISEKKNNPQNEDDIEVELDDDL
jgi:hypothetical protein